MVADGADRDGGRGWWERANLMGWKPLWERKGVRTEDELQRVWTPWHVVVELDAVEEGALACMQEVTEDGSRLEGGGQRSL
eukprot:752907-Hanusia_phi.AAC.3